MFGYLKDGTSEENLSGFLTMMSLLKLLYYHLLFSSMKKAGNLLLCQGSGRNFKWPFMLQLVLQIKQREAGMGLDRDKPHAPKI